MAPRAGAALAAVLLAAAPLCASGAERAPLRALTYAVDVSTADSVDTSGGTINNGVRAGIFVHGRLVGGDTPTSGSGEKHSTASQASKGTISVDVVQATTDAGLVIDIAETTDALARPKVRMVIAGDGTLFFEPAEVTKLSEEELVVARWLGRGFYGDHPTDVGTAWVVDLSANGRSDVEHYRVLAHDAQQVTLAYAFEERTTIANAFAGTRQGSLVYDTALVVPVKASFQTIARRQVGAAYATVRTAVTLTLTADTFRRRPG